MGHEPRPAGSGKVREEDRLPGALSTQQGTDSLGQATLGPVFIFRGRESHLSIAGTSRFPCLPHLNAFERWEEGTRGWNEDPLCTWGSRGGAVGRDMRAVGWSSPRVAAPGRGIGRTSPRCHDTGSSGHHAAGSLRAEGPSHCPPCRPARLESNASTVWTQQPAVTITREECCVTASPWTLHPTDTASNSSVITSRLKVHLLGSQTSLRLRGPRLTRAFSKPRAPLFI